MSDADESPDRIERDMEQTRESITQKVEALETQVLGTIQTATDTITDAVQAFAAGNGHPARYPAATPTGGF